jgi:hypothetical protein
MKEILERFVDLPQTLLPAFRTTSCCAATRLVRRLQAAPFLERREAGSNSSPPGRRFQAGGTAIALIQTPSIYEEWTMTTQPVEQRVPDEKPDGAIDQTVEDTFPASDVPATGGATRLDDTEDSDAPGKDPDDDVPDEDTPGEPLPGDAPPDEAAPQGQR